jgi:hypothetical protein
MYARQEFGVRTDPDPEAPLRATLPRGFPVKVLSESEDHHWYWVELSKGIRAWAEQSELAPEKPDEPPSQEVVLSPEELKQFHHLLAIEKAFTFNFGFLAGRTSLNATSGRDPHAYTALSLGPGVGQRVPTKNTHYHFFLEAKAIFLLETYADAYDHKSVNSAGGELGVRFLWIHNASTGGGVYLAGQALLPIHYENDLLEKPVPIGLRGGVSVSVALAQSLVLLFDIGGYYRPQTFGAEGAMSFLF